MRRRTRTGARSNTRPSHRDNVRTRDSRAEGAAEEAGARQGNSQGEGTREAGGGGSECRGHGKWTARTTALHPDGECKHQPPHGVTPREGDLCRHPPPKPRPATPPARRHWDRGIGTTAETARGKQGAPASYKWTCVVARYSGRSPHRGPVHCGSPEEPLWGKRDSCLPRWTVCPTRSPSLGTNHSTCRGEYSVSGPLSTPPGRCQSAKYLSVCLPNWLAPSYFWKFMAQPIATPAKGPGCACTQQGLIHYCNKTHTWQRVL